MEILRGILLITFLISILRNTIYQLFLWQLKEYRLDRFLVHLQTWQGRKLLFGKIATTKWLFLLFATFLYFIVPRLFFFAVLAIFSFEALFYLKQLLSGAWRFPVFTLKTILILALTILLLVLGYIFFPTPLAVKVLFIDRGLLFLMGTIIILTNIPAKLYHQYIIQKAKEKIKNHPHLLSIGITGSYGKTSTKEFLSQILSQRFKVLKTPANINTDIGVAKVILKNLKKDHQIFVCEMGAYKKGEIKAICKIVNPRIGIITGINEQHLSLFGSLENTMKAKFELIEALPKKGLAIFNGNNKYCLQMAQRAKKMGREVKIIKRQKVISKADLPGKYFLENALLAKAVAQELGIAPTEIAQMAKKLKLPPHTMQIFKKDGLTLIDDTYNSNPQGVLAALDHLKAYKGKKILVFQPMIELGKASGRLHEKVGRKAAEICDQIFLTNQNFYQDFLRGAKGKVSLRKDLLKIKRGAILFEGREAGRVLKFLISN